MIVGLGQCLVDKHRGTHRDLDVWRGEVWRCGDEAPTLGDIGGERAASLFLKQPSILLTRCCK